MVGSVNIVMVIEVQIVVFILVFFRLFFMKNGWDFFFFWVDGQYGLIWLDMIKRLYEV